MDATFHLPYISDGAVKAICWTLIHSLWIGLVIALLCGVIIATTRKSAAILRYRLLCSLLAVFVCAIGITYYLEAGTVSPSSTTGKGKIEGMLIKGHNDVVINQAIIPQNQTLLNSAQAFLNQNMSIIFIVWLLFFALKSLKMVSGLLYIQRIRNYKTQPVTEEFKHKIEQLSSQMGIRRAVRLVQSELVKVPVAVGWLKPMILLPVGIVFQLTPEQLEGILWHELAHIRRHDYLVNILQGLVETVFFFNPGLLWLSSLIRTEREACCDDMVLSRMNRKANYLEALLSFGYGEFNQARYAMSIGSGNQLRDRLKRMISQENKRLSVAEKSVLAVGLVLLTAFTTISKDTPVIKQLTVKFTGKTGKIAGKTFPVSMDRLSGEQRVNDSKPGNSEKKTIIMTDTAIRFKTVLFKNTDADPANSDISAMDEKGNKYHFVVVKDQITVMEINDEKVPENKLPDYAYMVRYIERELAEKKRVRDGDLVNFKALAPEARLDAMKLQMLKDSMKAMGRPVATEYSQDGEPWPKTSKSMKMQQRMHADSVGYAAELKKMMNIVAGLVKDKIVANAADVKWFGLSNTEFIVNGQKLSNEMQQRYKAKYGVHEDYGLYYGPVQMTGRGVFINDDTQDPNTRMLNFQRDRTQELKLRDQQLQDQDARLKTLSDDAAKTREEQFKSEELKLKQLSIDRAKWQKERDQYLGDQNARQKNLRDDFKFGIDLQPAITGVIADLVNANVINDKSDLIKFNLTNSALMVNGKRQPDELHDRLKAKYLGQPNYSLKFGIANDPNFGLHFNAQNGEQGLGITSGPDSP